ncbi:hypothetical protein Ancab_025527 [Ancistrocladus abbreviatus]
MAIRRTDGLLEWLLIIILPSLLINLCHGQQAYVNNKQDDCYNKNYNYTYGNLCNGPLSSCTSYLTFRPNPPSYNSPLSIAYLFGVSSSEITQINQLSAPTTIISSNEMVIVPVNCSCSNPGSRGYYQYNVTYKLQSTKETYFTVANITFEGQTTCQAMIAQNPYDSHNLSVGLNLKVPLRCACPSSSQTKNGIKYLLSYLVTWGDSVSAIGDIFGVDEQSILEANELSGTATIYPFTPILVPLKSVPTKINLSPPPPPPAPTPQSPTPPPGGGGGSKKWVFVVVGVVCFLLLLAVSLFLFLRRRAPRKPAPYQKGSGADGGDKVRGGGNSDENEALATSKDETSNSTILSISSEGLRQAIESLTVYKYEELQQATDSFSEDRRIKGSVFRGSFKGDDAAVKILNGDVSGEINILKRINHTSIIRLSGFCVHDGNTYLVYEYAEKGSLRDWLHGSKKDESRLLVLGWKQRVQIAKDIADALNYLHNYISPPYIHKNLSSSNVLLDANFRAKVTNFGLARTVEEDGDGLGGFHLTRHVVGTQGYMAPEYIENGVVTPKLDVFAFGMVMLELLSGKVAATASSHDEINGKGGEEMLYASTIEHVLEGENVRGKLESFMDADLGHEYPLQLAYSMAQLANSCVARDMNSRPSMAEALIALSKIHSSSLDWDPSSELDSSSSLSVQVSR